MMMELALNVLQTVRHVNLLQLAKHVIILSFYKEVPAVLAILNVINALLQVGEAVRNFKVEF